MPSFPDEVLEHVLVFLTSSKDRNAVSLVCKAWYRAEAWGRRSVFIGNIYAVSPEIVVRRFPRIRSLTLKGKPRFADFNLVPPNWGADVLPWLLIISSAYPMLEELRLKRMTVTDESLELLAHSFPNFRALSLTSCDGFSTDGLAIIASDCRQYVDVQDDIICQCHQDQPKSPSHWQKKIIPEFINIQYAFARKCSSDQEKHFGRQPTKSWNLVLITQ
eukprot:Gb_04515 [translate_table: standard]